MVGIIPERLYAAMDSAGFIGITQLAKTAGVGISYLSYASRGALKNGGTVYCLCKICDTLGCSADYLLGRSDQP